MFEFPTCAFGGAVTEVISVELKLNMGHVEDRPRVICGRAGWRGCCGIERNGEYEDAVRFR